ncbi:GNAT family N-acetyltransferase [Pacificoceanicola onchidii]|uniref:GNAT family N-acetyltransferase n=1 Tax=Pacificoceanicola onchidii TaxID=2562685 RepID=UPI0014560E66|nr:GNAT family N-acetyltransferase [Pacificoceanicola onchidii]
MLRWATSADFDDLGQLMFDAIHASPSPYSPAQRQAWLSEPRSGADWAARLAAQRVALLDLDGPRGFATLRADGYVDMVFLAAQARGRGYFRALIDKIVTDAIAQRIPELTTHASLAAQGPFAALGFEHVRDETVSRDGQTLARAFMRRALPPVIAPLSADLVSTPETL